MGTRKRRKREISDRQAYELALEHLKTSNQRMKEAIEAQKRLFEAIQQYEEETGDTRHSDRVVIDMPRTDSQLSREIGAMIERIEHSPNVRDVSLEVEANIPDNVELEGFGERAKAFNEERSFTATFPIAPKDDETKTTAELADEFRRYLMGFNL